MNKLYYTVEEVLASFASIITHNLNLPKQIIDCYIELQSISKDLNVLVNKTGMDQDELSDEIYIIYQDMIDLYIEYLEKEAN